MPLVAINLSYLEAMTERTCKDQSPNNKHTINNTYAYFAFTNIFKYVWSPKGHV